MKTNTKNILKTIIIAAMIIIPSMATASSAKIGSFRNNLSPEELKLLNREENKSQRNGAEPDYQNVNVTIGSVRASLSESEAKSLYLDENKGQAIKPESFRGNFNATIGSVRANLNSKELAQLRNEEVKAR